MTGNGTVPENGRSTAVAMTVTKPGARLAPQPMEVAPPQPGWVRVAVAASGVRYADIATAAAPKALPSAPVTPGHEVAGVVAELGDDVEEWAVGDPSASAGSAEAAATAPSAVAATSSTARVARYRGCPTRAAGPRRSVPASALARIPEGMDFFDAAPMGCAGVTTFNAVRKGGVTAGGIIAVFGLCGLGGLGHLAVQFAAAMGYRAIAIARGPGRAAIAQEFGAADYIDSVALPAGAALADLGGADLIVCTAPTTEPVADLLTGLRVGGRLTLIGIDSGSIHVPVAKMVMNGQTLTGHLTAAPATPRRPRASPSPTASARWSNGCFQGTRTKRSRACGRGRLGSASSWTRRRDEAVGPRGRRPLDSNIEVHADFGAVR
jgi:D-arabinose 1-dehydrogenase-like Zn-dependent alcohol dehydrogenase